MNTTHCVVSAISAGLGAMTFRNHLRSLNEGRSARMIGAGLSGIGGLYSGGTTVGAVQAHQQTKYAQQIARRKGDKSKEFEEQQKAPMKSIGKSLLGTIPIVGSVSNVMNQQKLERQKDELRKLNQKKK
jgi:hypothetical protein